MYTLTHTHASTHTTHTTHKAQKNHTHAWTLIHNQTHTHTHTKHTNTKPPHTILYTHVAVDTNIVVYRPSEPHQYSVHPGRHARTQRSISQ